MWWHIIAALGGLLVLAATPLPALAQNVSSSGGGGGGGLSCTAGTSPVAAGNVGCNTVTVTSAQLKAINGNPVTLLASPGAGNLIVLTSYTASYKFVTGAYTGGDAPTVNYTNFAGDQAGQLLPASGFLTAASSQYSPGQVINGFSLPGSFKNPTASDLNKPVVFADDINYATGSGTLTFTLLYTVITP